MCKSMCDASMQRICRPFVPLPPSLHCPPSLPSLPALPPSLPTTHLSGRKSFFPHKAHLSP